ncbi:DUF1707 domain-containing protein [Kribbella albertanoniae]|uniref:DUF1707 SHOCT-like domain-containing protein n=1 Tax=Kribbella albertanoniae TaxID=1266829 RepID=UPI00192D447D|nr:DUF1707 domain-containing protein [Kribbella albertanoniae]
MSLSPDDSSRRIGDEDRNTAVQRLQSAYTGGFITHEELDERLQQVLTAKQQNELEVALSALPAERPATTATIGAAGGRIRRRGVWKVPRNLKVESAYGQVYLDLSQAIIEDPVVDLELQLGTGQARIRVPRNAIVEIVGFQTGWKDVSYKPRQPNGPTGPTIRITGAMGFGRLKVRHARS